MAWVIWARDLGERSRLYLAQRGREARPVGMLSVGVLQHSLEQQRLAHQMLGRPHQPVVQVEVPAARIGLALGEHVPLEDRLLLHRSDAVACVVGGIDVRLERAEAGRARLEYRTDRRGAAVAVYRKGEPADRSGRLARQCDRSALVLLDRHAAIDQRHPPA